MQGVSPDLGNVSTHNVISNVGVNNVGEIVGEGAGIFFCNVSNSTIEYVNVHDGPRAGIELVGRFTADGAAKSYAAGNLVQYAKIAKFCQDSGDIGGLYVGETGDSGTPGINTFQQITVDSSAANASMADAAPDGVFTDDHSNVQVMKNISVTNSQGADYRSNAGVMTETNVSWRGGFSAAGIDTWNIGTKSGFPY